MKAISCIPETENYCFLILPATILSILFIIMDSSTYRHLIGQLKKSCAIPHHNFPSHNLLSLENLFEISKDFDCDPCDCGISDLNSFPYCQPFPYGVQRTVAFFPGSGSTDDATELVKKKSNWEKKLKDLRVSNIDLAVKQIREISQNKIVKISKNLRQYIEHFHCDPEPMFSGNYNWLYTGGCLTYNESFDGTTLISSDFFAKKPGFNILKLSNSLDEIQFKSFGLLKSHSPVLQVTSKSNYSQQGAFIFCVRQKNYLSLFSNNGANPQPVKLWRKKVQDPKILTCVDIKADCDEIIVTDSNYDVNIFNIERKNKIYGLPGKKTELNSNRNCWSQIAFGDLGVYWAYRNSFVILDERDIYSGAKLQYTPSSATNKCEDICSFVRSPNDLNYIYLSTTHNILQVDLRSGKSVQRWTHQMKQPPQFLSVVSDEGGSELLMLQSQSVDEISGIANKLVENSVSANFLSRSLPCLLKNIKESLKLAHFHGICLNPFIAKRLDFSTTGMLCIKDKMGDINLFTQNSGGDIFLSKIGRKTVNDFLTEEDKQKIVSTMMLYESHFEKFPLKESIKSHMEFRDMRPVVEDIKHSKAKTKAPEKPEIHWKCHEMYSPESLVFYRDILAKRILKVWGHSCEDTDQDETTMSVDDKVREWMDKY